MTSARCPPYQSYRILVTSSDVVAPGDWRDGRYYIDLDFLSEDTQWQLMVESFSANLTMTTALLLHCGTIAQKNSYSTSTKGPSDVLCIIPGLVAGRVIESHSIGLGLMDHSCLRGKLHRIYFTSLDGLPVSAVDVFGAGLVWAMTIVVYPIVD